QTNINASRGGASTLAREIINGFLPHQLANLANILKEPSFHKRKSFGLTPENKAIQRKLQQRMFGCERQAHERATGYYLTRADRIVLFNALGKPIYEVPRSGEPRKFVPNGKTPDIIELRWLWCKDNPHCYKIASGLAALQICDIAVELPERRRVG